MEQVLNREALIPIQSVTGSTVTHRDDSIAIEEPLEISVGTNALDQEPISITMRTPGNDSELSLGFMLTEGLVQSASDVLDHGHDFTRCTDGISNRYWFTFKPGNLPDAGRMKRNFYTTSSCGVCGKASIDALRLASKHIVVPPSSPLPFEVLTTLPQTLMSRQRVFSKTGGLHAAGLFSFEGSLLLVREDVGRHNAVDKLIGGAALDESISVGNKILLLSGRTSFELVQKAVMVGIPVIASIGAPSSLAVSLAKENSITLVGFLGAERFNVYTGFEHVTTS